MTRIKLFKTQDKTKAVDNQRFLWLDALKGYGILLVMLSHIHCNDIIGFFSIGYMPLFFIASGFVDHKPFSKQVLWGKAKRLLLPYFIYGVICTIVYDWLFAPPHTSDGNHEWLGLLYSRFCLYPLGSDDNVFFLPMSCTAPLWFLTCLFVGFFLYYLFFQIIRIREIYGILICVGFSMVFSKMPILFPWSLDTAFMVAIFIKLGVYCRSRLPEILSSPFRACFLFATIYSLIVILNGGGNFSVRIYGRTSFLSVFLFIALGATYFLFVSCLFTITPVRITKIFAFVGRLSLRLMCIHMLLFCMMGKFLGEILNYKILVVLDIIVAILVAWLLEIIFRMSNRKFLTRYL